MKTLAEIKQILLLQKSTLQKKYPIDKLAIFGSYSRNEQTDKSDIDILVGFTKPIGMEFIDLCFELENLLQNKVDLVSINGIKPKYLDAIKNEIVYV